MAKLFFTGGEGEEKKGIDFFYNLAGLLLKFSCPSIQQLGMLLL